MVEVKIHFSVLLLYFTILQHVTLQQNDARAESAIIFTDSRLERRTGVQMSKVQMPSQYYHEPCRLVRPPVSGFCDTMRLLQHLW